MTYRKKLIEVALPLDAINRESAKEKHPSTRGHPRGIHVWWARRPLATCKAMIFASLVDDPGNDLSGERAEKERERLFRIIEDLVKWENTNSEVVLDAARNEILKSTKAEPPPILDPFCGSGSIPLEAQRLGLEAYASDLNPVAVLISKALIELPPGFIGRPPINPDSKNSTGGTASWERLAGLAADISYYGKWMNDRAWERIGTLYPKSPNGDAVIGWIWARTIKCPNPACGGQIPLLRSFWLSTKPGKEVWVEPIIDKKNKTLRLEVRKGKGHAPSGTVNRAVARCLICDGIAPAPYVRAEANAHRMGALMEAIITNPKHGFAREYLKPREVDLNAMAHAEETLKNLEKAHVGPLTLVPNEPCRGTFGSNAQGATYGFFKFQDYFNARQLATLSIFHNLISEVRAKVLNDSHGDSSYANAITTYLGLALSRLLDFGSTLCWWRPDSETTRGLFARQAIPMTWDYVEVNLFGSLVNLETAIKWVIDSLSNLPAKAKPGKSVQLDASQALIPGITPMVITDPPYYDNMSYADLSDFFYVWLRRSLGELYPELFSTMLTPKQQELIAESHRFGGDREKAEKHFESGLGRTFALVRNQARSDYPLILYYAFKQEEEAESDDSTNAPASKGWETMLKGLLDTGFQITGTWPVRTEQQQRAVASGTNALASSIVIACRPRPKEAPIATRRDFLSALRKELPGELKVLMNGRVAPVDLAQATIGPAMAIFSRYSKVLEADGSAMMIRAALQEINYFLEDFMAQQEGDLDVESQFCIAWFQQYGTRAGQYGEADVLARAKNISVEGISKLGLVDSAKGVVRLTLRDYYEEGWDPGEQTRLTAWEACQRLVWTLSKNGEQEAGRIARRLGGLADQARELAYRLYGIADRKGWAEEASGYNALVVSWSEIQKAAAAAAEETQGRMV